MNKDDSMEENEEGGSLSSYIIVAIIAFALGLGSGYLWASKKAPAVSGNEQAPTTTDQSSANTSDVSGGTTSTGGTSSVGMMIARDALIVRDQTAGTSVKISQINLTEMGWVVVREDDGSGAPGKILGAQLFDPGTAANGVVELLRGTEIGGTYYAVIYKDNGDRAFDPKLDSPLLGDDGKPRMTTFKATDAAGDKTAEPTNI